LNELYIVALNKPLDDNATIVKELIPMRRKYFKATLRAPEKDIEIKFLRKWDSDNYKILSDERRCSANQIGVDNKAFILDQAIL